MADKLAGLYDHLAALPASPSSAYQSCLIRSLARNGPSLAGLLEEHGDEYGPIIFAQKIGTQIGSDVGLRWIRNPAEFPVAVLDASMTQFEAIVIHWALRMTGNQQLIKKSEKAMKKAIARSVHNHKGIRAADAAIVGFFRLLKLFG